MSYLFGGVVFNVFPYNQIQFKIYNDKLNSDDAVPRISTKKCAAKLESINFHGFLSIVEINVSGSISFFCWVKN